MNMCGSSIAFLINRMSPLNILKGIFFGIAILSVPSLASDIVSHFILLKNDYFFSLRRCIALSFFSCGVWLFIFIIRTLLKPLISFDIIADAFFLGLFIIIPIRSISILSISQSNFFGKILFVIMQPMMCLISATYFFQISAAYSFSYFFIEVTLSIVAVCAFINYIKNQGLKKIGISPIGAFSAFLIAWLDKKNFMLEKLLDEIGVKHKISITTLQFRSKESKKNKGLMVISNFHPGPFMNVGSSILPYLIQRHFEKKMDIVVSVPHGISGHEGNLVSQQENKKVISAIEDALRGNDFLNGTSMMIYSTDGDAKSNCQRFNGSAIITLTQSPKDMEDIPLDVGSSILEEGKKYFNKVAIIDAHNSITRVRDYSKEEIEAFKKSASVSIEKASRSPLQKFKFGSIKKIFDNYALEDGFGPGGLVVFLIEVAGKIMAYLTIDGNNMVPELRHKILTKLKEEGIEQGEIMTTDTHMVNGLISSGLGYHPVGEDIDQESLVYDIGKAIKEAKRNLEESQVSVCATNIEVKSLGSRTFENLTGFMYGASKLVLAYLMFLVFGSFILGLILL